MAYQTGSHSFEWSAFLGSAGSQDRVALAARENGRWRDMSYGDLRRTVERLASELVAHGVAPGDRVGILAEGRPEWPAALLAVFRCGAVAAPLDPKLTSAELAGQLQACQPAAVCVSSVTEPIASKATGSASSAVVLIDREPGTASVAQGPPAPFVSRHPDELALITYTSGTTGDPRGVMTSFGNLLFQAEGCASRFSLGPEDVSLAMLPPNHLFELSAGLLSMLSVGGQICFLGSVYPEDVLEAIRARKITRMAVVPLFLRLLRQQLERRGAPDLRDEVGPSFREFICGGAALDPDLAQFFFGLGYPVYEGYGLTETSPVIASNAPGRNRIGSVGQPLPGVEVRIARERSVGESEILTRGPHVMLGYYQREDLTRAVIDGEGWFHTGDLGYLDENGYLYVTGRIKDLIVLGGGKNVLPAEVEGHLLENPAFSEVCVLGRTATDGTLRGTEEVWAVVVPNAEMGSKADPGWAQHEVERVIGKLAPYKRPTHVILRREELPKTTSRKVQREVVRRWLEAQDAI